MKEVSSYIRVSPDVRMVLREAVQFLGEYFQADQVVLVPYAFDLRIPPVEWILDQSIIESRSVIAQLLRKKVSSNTDLSLEHHEGGHLYLGVSGDDAELALGIALFKSKPLDENDSASLHDFILEITSICRRSLRLANSNSSQKSLKSQNEILLRESEIIYFILDSDTSILQANVPARTLLSRSGVLIPLRDQIAIEDVPRLNAVLDYLSSGSMSVYDEFRFPGDHGSIPRWFRLGFHREDINEDKEFRVHVVGRNTSLIKEATEMTTRQERTIQALFGVTAAVGNGSSPNELAEEGIRALCVATGASAGVCYLFDRKNTAERSLPKTSPHDLSLIATVGLSSELEERYVKTPCPEIFSWVAKTKEPLILPNIKSDSVNWWMIPAGHGGTCLVTPIRVISDSLGVLVLLHNEERTIDPSYVKLSLTAASQIGLAARQSTLVLESQRNAKNLSALYRLSHELSSSKSFEDVFQTAFQIMREELDIERFWLGLVNETGTRVIGQAAYGPGWKKKLIEINIDISKESHPLAEVVRTKRPIILDDVEKGLPGIGLKRFMLKNGIDAVGIVPLVASGQVLGVLAFEGERDGALLTEKDLSLLFNFASELASVLLAMRLEERVASGETMRAAGLLAAGIAHNFNNVLQGILGQASLLELYSEKPEQVKKSALMVSEAATKGAALVRQLLSFAHLEEPMQEPSDITSLIENNKTSLQRILKDRQYISYDISENLPKAHVDPRHFVRIVTALMTNSSEAMDFDGCVEIIVDEVNIDKNSPHYEVPYGNYVRIGIRDNGIGMDSETRKRCFEPFFTTKNLDPSSGLSLKGEGMGLSAAYALARKNGGRLVVDSRKKHGSLFTLYLPVEPKQKEEQEDVSFNLSSHLEVRQDNVEKKEGELYDEEVESESLVPSRVLPHLKLSSSVGKIEEHIEALSKAKKTR